LHANNEVVAPQPTSSTLEGLMAKVVRHPALLATVRPRDIGRLPVAAKMSVVKERRRRSLKRLSEKYERQDPFEQALFERLTSDPDFFREFDATPDDQT
jgi:hypothetical protein